MSAYNENYLNDAMKNLGEAFDYAVNRCKKDPDEFAGLFIASGVADHFGKGNPKYVVGKSGTELAMDVLISTGEDTVFPNAQVEYDCSAEYWAGWILAFYQWKSGKTFKNILSNVSMTYILKLYPTLHEASEEKSADTIDIYYEQKNNSTKLQQQRKKYGYSQRKLAEKAGVSLRTLQQYELGTKDIRKASVSSVLSLANTLGCGIEDIV